MKSTNINNPFRKVFSSSTNNQHYLSKKNLINKEDVYRKFFSNQEIKNV